jgi:hypothetical protein
MNAPAKLKTVENVLDELPADTLHSAMARAFAEIEAATKSAENPAFKQGGKASKYADLTSVIGAIKPALISHGLFFTQRCLPAEDGVSVETVLHHRGGEKESLGTLYVPANKRDPQGFGSALTYARRYALQTAFCVPVEDDDGNAGASSMKVAETASKFITQKQHDDLVALATEADVPLEQIRVAYKIGDLAHLPADLFDRAVRSLNRAIELNRETVNA